MKILVVIPILFDGGAERVVSVLTKEWAKIHDVRLVLFEQSEQDYDHGGRLIDLDIPATTNHLRKMYNSVRRIMRLSQVMMRERPDRVISFLDRCNVISVAAAIMTGYQDRLYVSVRINPSFLHGIYKILLPLIYRFPARIIAVSEGVKIGLKSIHISPERVSVITNPVFGTNRYTFEHKAPSPLSNRYILGVGRLDYQKGFDLLLSAFHTLKQSDTHLVILGQGSEKSALVIMAQKLGIEKRVHFPGFISNIEIWYRNAECFVLSSRMEGYPNVLLEAMANSCPVVSFDCNYGPSEIIEHNENGLIVPDGDVEALGKAIDRVLGDADLSKKIVDNARLRVSDFDVKKIAPLWL